MLLLYNFSQPCYSTICITNACIMLLSEVTQPFYLPTLPCYSSMLLNQVAQPCFSTLLLSHVNTTMLFNHVNSPWYLRILLSYVAPIPCYSAMVFNHQCYYYHVTQQCYLTKLINHAIQPYYSAMLLNHASQPCYLAMLLMKVTSHAKEFSPATD
jgi:hypothetical protein